MRIGILTFHRADNVGAVLQAWSLQQYLIKLGHQVCIIDYRCKAIESDYDIWHPRLLWSRKNIFRSITIYIARIKNLKIRSLKRSYFENFRKNYLLLTNSVADVSSIPKLDIYISGSDQVWNTSLTNGYNLFYCLDFSARRKIAYAASTEKKSFQMMQRDDREKLMNALKAFDAISVREAWIKEKLELFNVKNCITVCLDPVFLLSKESFSKVAAPPIEKDYVFVYQVMESPLCKDLSDLMAKKYNLKVVFMHASQKSCKEGHLYAFGPSEFLGYIENAKFVITTSFHGMAFSIIFQKNFWVVDTGLSNRMKNILDMAGLNDRLVSSANSFIDASIDYSLVENKIDRAVKTSKDYLIANIK